jgi:hypothetical protein
MDFSNRGYIPTPASNHQNCECGSGVPVLTGYRGNIAIFECGACKAVIEVITRGR